ncbi:DUF488 domain-containing protein [Alicyclobacillus sp.]|uniref:DUF488 domain-containing protein n=1 Tax=Alicyclobacillus sp. TaxID=61169 RepID=UPI0025B9A5F6|nr:DUF488 family protein [Alicyclobacillus sp.]MCL6517186.1 DUF488 family protein [Alicyclobacillus sp.]
MGIQVKRVYDAPSPADGTRILVDRLWPRGVRKEDARIDLWWKDIAPSPELRTWFGHRPERFAAFRDQYRVELTADPVRRHLVEELARKSAEETVTLVYGAKDPVHNHVQVILEVLRDIPFPS